MNPSNPGGARTEARVSRVPRTVSPGGSAVCLSCGKLPLGWGLRQTGLLGEEAPTTGPERVDGPSLQLIVAVGDSESLGEFGARRQVFGTQDATVGVRNFELRRDRECEGKGFEHDAVLVSVRLRSKHAFGATFLSKWFGGVLDERSVTQ